MSEATGPSVRLAPLQVRLVGCGSRKEFPKIIGFPSLFRHHRSFNFLGEGWMDWLLFIFGF